MHYALHAASPLWHDKGDRSKVLQHKSQPYAVIGLHFQPLAACTKKRG